MTDTTKTQSNKGFYFAIFGSLALIVVLTVGLISLIKPSTPNLVGEWRGVNRTVSDLKGFSEWEKTVHITEQKDRRFRGHFEYSEGRKDFFGVIHPGRRTFTWVASDSKGYNFGRVHRRNKISACYVEAWEEATAGCAVLKRRSD